MPLSKPKRNRDIWNMRYRQGWTFSRIAQAYGISKQAAHAIVQRVNKYDAKRKNEST